MQPSLPQRTWPRSQLPMVAYTLRKEVEGPSLLMPGYGFQMFPSPYLSRPNYTARDPEAIS